MAENRGGYQRPKNPAPTSGPGALSKRTDGGPTQAAKYMPGLEYGQGQVNMINQQSAPLAGNPMTSAPKYQDFRAGERDAGIVPLDAPSQRPNEPITQGVNIGKGLGSEALSMTKPDDTNFRTNISSYRPVLNYISDQPNTSPETRQAIRQLLDQS